MLVCDAGAKDVVQQGFARWWVDERYAAAMAQYANVLMTDGFTATYKVMPTEIAALLKL